MFSKYFEYAIKSLLICRHNSLVGESIIACGYFLSQSILCTMGIPKAAVFPVPVCAKAMRSSFLSISVIY